LLREGGPSTGYPLPDLRQAIQRSIDLGLVPMLEMHDATGERSNASMLALAQYLARSDVAELLREFEEHKLVNISNEWSGVDFAAAYSEAIDILRAAGVHHTLVIDSNGWGQNAGTIIQEAPGLLEHDPQGNLLFSIHVYERFADESGEPHGSRIRGVIQRAVADRIPLIVGEFGFQHGDDGSGNPRSIPFDAMMQEANRYGIGYLAWSWTGNSGGVEYLDLVDRLSGELTPWGVDLVDGPSTDVDGIRETAVPASVFTPE
jgi:hypothetical protein